ncbi:methyl-accepting chemotaxis sensory transducer with Cache sensor [Malaciobacter marinus]|uniref:Methyl-accepting chemotaxis sensory transducer with Cache sensor n=1 Tax=Malaciobacter marinus TaxID=505249 RepID=A0AB36ZXG2_9BACT|nr:methyl-accepting chemotaxis protein [Malaciobacter marinus]PPK61035.1 methyl-accepting chemotaxis sensory transducer with Cache sensor [Malaciobacter marinus]
MLKKLNNLNIVSKTTILLALVLSILLISLNVFSAAYTKNIISDKVNAQLKERLHQITETLLVYDDLLKNTADSLYSAFDSQFSNIQIDPSKTVKVNGVDTPLITNNGITLNNNFDYVDYYTKLKGSTATVFAKMGNDFVRVTTSLKRPDGSRTLGTFLGEKSPAYDVIMSGKKYFGTAHLFGSDYMAVYNPIIKNGEVIGILYVGYNYTKSFTDFKKRLKKTKIGENGYLYIVSTKKKTKGKFILHPTKEGKNILEANSDENIKNMFKHKEGMLEYDWTNPKTNEIQSKITIFKDYEDRGWKVVIGTTKDDFLQESKEFTIILAILSILSIVVVAGVILYVIKKLVVTPLHNLQTGLIDFFDFLNGTKKDTKEILVKSSDEIGVMSKVINENVAKIEENIKVDNELIENTVEVANFVSKGYLDKKISKSSNNKMLNELKDVVNSMLDNINHHISNVQNLLNAYTDYDYTKSLDTKAVEADIKKLYENSNILGQSATNMLKQNLKNGEDLQNSAKELNDIISSLSNSSNEQAASLEETAASLEELTSTMKNSQQSMQKMKANSQTLSNEVATGEKHASNTALSMDEINEQTQSIAEAITIIDQIAFQTNILSLNAAVEAATAGEAGKGFAVVAQEVRNLANRSAEAASQIKHIVENAAIKASEGKEITKQMINGYKKLRENIQETTQIISQVTNTSNEQLNGLEQINHAVNDLDKITQTNATVARKATTISDDTNKISQIIVQEAKKAKLK